MYRVAAHEDLGVPSSGLPVRRQCGEGGALHVTFRDLETGPTDPYAGLVSLLPGQPALPTKLILALQRCVVATIDEARLTELGYATNTVDLIETTHRLRRSLHWRDPDFGDHVFTLLRRIGEELGEAKLYEVAEFLKLPTWLVENQPVLFSEVYAGNTPSTPVVPATHVQAALSNVLSIPVGSDDATNYHRGVFDLLKLLFASSLADMAVEEEIASGTKRVDIVGTNIAAAGFFYWIKENYPPCAFIFIECKNYTGEVSNPEIDQLLGRLSDARGKLGLLICRQAKDPNRLQLRCREASLQGQGRILALTDANLATLVGEHGQSGQEFPSLRRKFKELVM